MGALIVGPFEGVTIAAGAIALPSQVVTTAQALAHTTLGRAMSAERRAHAAVRARATANSGSARCRGRVGNGSHGGRSARRACGRGRGLERHRQVLFGQRPFLAQNVEPCPILEQGRQLVAVARQEFHTAVLDPW